MTMHHIATATVGAGGSGSIILMDNIPQTFSHLQVRLTARGTISANSDLTYFWNAPAGITTAQWHILSGDGSSVTSGNGTAAVYAGKIPAATAISNVFGAIIVDILDYSSTTKLKTFRCAGGYDNNGSGVSELWSGLWSGSTNPINSIRLNCGSGGFAQYSRADLYGITNNPITTGA